MSDQLIAAQPLIGSLAHDPSLRGLFDALALFVNGAGRRHAEAIDKLDPTLTAIGKAVRAALGGNDAAAVLAADDDRRGRPTRRELRRFVLTRPVLDFDLLEPGAQGRRRSPPAGAELGLDPAARGAAAHDRPGRARRRAVRDIAGRRAALDRALDRARSAPILFAAVRSVKLVGAILATLFAGLVLTAGFAALAIGSLEPDLGRVRRAVHRPGGRFQHPVQHPLPRPAASPRLRLPAALDGAAR